MAMAAHSGIAMINADYLRAVQYLSPAFPIGAFAYSQGLEYAISAGLVTDAGSLQDWIAAQLSFGTARMDAILIAHARSGDLQDLADLAYAFASSAERDLELREMGRAYVAQISHLKGQDVPALPLPVAIGASTRGLDVPTADILALFLQGLVGQIVSVGVRFIPLGQSVGQEVLTSLAPLILDIAAQAARAELEDISTSTIGADMAQMWHETQEVRIYRT
ncbi:MAG: urease accessory UreF family protein [Cypionkella sp.]|nr:urease accessory UreF family protein [Cypionkella sp.]